jgi:hypothetical protein
MKQRMLVSIWRHTPTVSGAANTVLPIASTAVSTLNPVLQQQMNSPVSEVQPPLDSTSSLLEQ